MLGCGSPNLDNTKTLDEIIADAIDGDNLQERSEEREELFYAPNEQTPYTGWVKEMWGNGRVKKLKTTKRRKESWAFYCL